MKIHLAGRLAGICALLFASALGAEASAAIQRFERPGPHTVSIERRALCCDREGHRIDLYRPQGGSQGRRFPVVTWGNGSWASPEKYDYLLRHVASWGFVVVATRDSAVASGATMLDALEELASQRSGTGLRLDLRNVAAVGHSQGAGGAMNALMAANGRIRTAIAISLPSPHFCSGRDCAEIPHGMPRGTSVFFMSGERDGLSPPRSIKTYYDAVPPGRDKLRGAVRGADHNDIQGDPDCGFLAFGCRQGATSFIGYITAWLRWRLTGDAAAATMFEEHAAPSIFSDPRWRDVEGSGGHRRADQAASSDPAWPARPPEGAVR